MKCLMIPATTQEGLRNACYGLYSFHFSCASTLVVGFTLVLPSSLMSGPVDGSWNSVAFPTSAAALPTCETSWVFGTSSVVPQELDVFILDEEGRSAWEPDTECDSPAKVSLARSNGGLLHSAFACMGLALSASPARTVGGSGNACTSWREISTCSDLGKLSSFGILLRRRDLLTRNRSRSGQQTQLSWKLKEKVPSARSVHSPSM